MLAAVRGHGRRQCWHQRRQVRARAGRAALGLWCAHSYNARGLTSRAAVVNLGAWAERRWFRFLW